MVLVRGNFMQMHCGDESSADLMVWSAAPVLNDARPPACLYLRWKLWPESF